MSSVYESSFFLLPTWPSFTYYVRRDQQLSNLLKSSLSSSILLSNLEIVPSTCFEKMALASCTSPSTSGNGTHLQSRSHQQQQPTQPHPTTTSFPDSEWLAFIHTSSSIASTLTKHQLDLNPNFHAWFKSILVTVQGSSSSRNTEDLRSNSESLYSPLTFYQKQSTLQKKTFTMKKNERNLAKQWLQSACETHLSKLLTPLFSVDTLYDLIITTTKSSTSMEDLPSLLVELIGIEHLDFIQQLLSHEHDLRLLVTQPTVLSLDTSEASINATASVYKEKGALPHVYLTQPCLPVTPSQTSLPANTIRVLQTDYEAFTLPAPNPPVLHTSSSSLVDIKATLPSWTHEVFSTYATFNPIQSKVFPEVFESQQNLLVCAPTGAGKCHGKDTPILMYDGSIKMVQDIKENDLLMGDDSTPRRVLSLASGKDEMYDIIPTKGEKYTVNSAHILCLKHTVKEEVSYSGRQRNFPNESMLLDKEDVNFKTNSFLTHQETTAFMRTFHEENKLVEMEVQDFLKLPQHIKNHLKGYRKGVEFKQVQVDFDPYIIGVWLGGGVSSHPCIHNQNASILNYLRTKLKQYHLHPRFKTQYAYSIVSNTNSMKNAFLDLLKNYNLINNKHIPNVYKINDRETRLAILAGLLDTSGSVKGHGYRIYQKSKKLSDDIVFLARSLGFAAYQKKCTIFCVYQGEKTKTDVFYRISISGEDLEDIPVKVFKKKATERMRVKDALVTEIKVKHIGRGEYYGFTLDGNRRYLLGDFTVTHNTEIALLAILKTIDFHAPYHVVYIAPLKALVTEIVHQFQTRLRCLHINVKEFTGDQALSATQWASTHVVVTTPEKWDSVTRKPNDWMTHVKLVVLDEVHLLHEERGAVLECIVARTQRYMETHQSLIRIIGLSATLPNYLDVATFLKVNPQRGLFYFDAGYRPVPLTQHFFGIKGKPGPQRKLTFHRVCYEKCKELVKSGHQVMVFVHARSETYASAMAFQKMASNENQLNVFLREESGVEGRRGRGKGVSHLHFQGRSKACNPQVLEVLQYGFGIHHAGLARSDRLRMESLFRQGAISVMFCTATLAWGVNLPAYAVVIQETDVYDTMKGKMVDLSILDVVQIFGRAGRPKYETLGEAFLLTTHAKLNQYMSAMTHQLPIESQFQLQFMDWLNAEISLGTVSSISEGVQWLGYTYFYVRMLKNPRHYGLQLDPQDPLLLHHRRSMVEQAATHLCLMNMVHYHAPSGLLAPKALGRIASHFYILHSTMAMMKASVRPGMMLADVLQFLCQCPEFSQIKFKEQDAMAIDQLQPHCYCQIDSTLSDDAQKINVLLQAYISNHPLNTFVSEVLLITQNAARLLRAFFEVALHSKYMDTAMTILELCKSIEQQRWSFEHPLAQTKLVSFEILEKISRLDPRHMDVWAMKQASTYELATLLRLNHSMAKEVKAAAWKLPWVSLTFKLIPISATVVELQLAVTCDFHWDPRVHGSVQVWWLWIQQRDGSHVYHVQSFRITKKEAFLGGKGNSGNNSGRGETAAGSEKAVVVHQRINIKLKLPEDESKRPSQLDLNWVSDTWLGIEETIPLNLNQVRFPDTTLFPTQIYTELLDLTPLPIKVLRNPKLIALYKEKVPYLNPIQTQLFHTLYYTSDNVLIGAPTGSGKTLAAELVMWQMFRVYPKGLLIYIAPMKALVHERVKDWKKKLLSLGREVYEWTGDKAPDPTAFYRKPCDVIVTTPEKWDGLTRGWKHRPFIQRVRCVILDELHLLGNERGAVLETLVSRFRYLATTFSIPIRLVGLSTALANPYDIAHWLNAPWIYNFRHTVRPVPLEVHLDGFLGHAYCPRMATMNKPCFRAILKHAPKKPTLIFVASRRQTRITANALIGFCCLDDTPKRFLHMSEADFLSMIQQVQDPSLVHALTFGIGLHHAGLVDSDRQLVESLFVNMHIQVLVATSTLAWGVNTPAHLVIVKGTEYYESKLKAYVDFPITDVLQMMGRAGRPGFDDKGVACVFVQESKKSFYKSFLNAPFPVESSLHLACHDTINAEIANQAIQSISDAINYISWTFLYIRLKRNPDYYDSPSASASPYGKEEYENEKKDPTALRKPLDVQSFITELLDQVCLDLERAGCIEKRGQVLESTPLGRIGAHFYIHYLTLQTFNQSVHPTMTCHAILKLISNAHEFKELPVRHNEENYNRVLAKRVPETVSDFSCPHAKTYLLLQGYLETCELPNVDYITDTQTILSQCPRLLQALLDVCVWKQYIQTSFWVVCVFQAIWCDMQREDPLVMVSEEESQDEREISEGDTAFFSNENEKKNEKEIKPKDELVKEELLVQDFNNEPKLPQKRWPPMSLDAYPRFQTFSMEVSSGNQDVPVLTCQCTWALSDFKLSTRFNPPIEEQHQPRTYSWYFFLSDPTQHLFLLKRNRVVTSFPLSLTIKFKEWTPTNSGTLTVFCDGILGKAQYQIQGFQCVVG
ncbi:hypothetical protein HMI54_003032 [Coelomomyces lativittatus]|nr:hypothetical protein HMI56_002560 [Coelomomyces lativittatus]KAJ1517039.1 hypothetical protein HMI55_000791 [Coelomomyces lativittatus]KAJ1518010.1 hypothetical protein HMI54_003032 [Coelomomyces lativittatus]